MELDIALVGSRGSTIDIVFIENLFSTGLFVGEMCGVLVLRNGYCGMDPREG